jgi:DNA-binding PadR family transcriptional regulator
MSAKLIILGILQTSSMHGYEIKHRIEQEKMAEWGGISYGAIYSALNTLAGDGFIEKTRTEQIGKRPSRDVYRITVTGREELLRLLREALSTMAHVNDPLDIGFRFLDSLPKQEVRELLEKRRAMIEQGYQMLSGLKSDFMKDHQETAYMDRASVLFDHWLLRLEAELTWHQRLQEIL